MSNVIEWYRQKQREWAEYVAQRPKPEPKRGRWLVVHEYRAKARKVHKPRLRLDPNSPTAVVTHVDRDAGVVTLESRGRNP